MDRIFDAQKGSFQALSKNPYLDFKPEYKPNSYIGYSAPSKKKEQTTQEAGTEDALKTKEIMDLTMDAAGPIGIYERQKKQVRPVKSQSDDLLKTEETSKIQEST